MTEASFGDIQLSRVGMRPFYHAVERLYSWQNTAPCGIVLLETSRASLYALWLNAH